MAEPARLPLRQGDSFEEEFPGASRSASECAVNLTRAASLFLAELARRRRPYADMSPGTFQILAIVEGEGAPLPPSVIAERMLTTSGTMTALLDTLQKRGLVRRIPNPADRRSLLVELTDAGREVVDIVLPVTHRITEEIFGHLSEAERERLIRSLGRVQERLEALRTEPVAGGPAPPRRRPGGAKRPRPARRRA